MANNLKDHLKEVADAIRVKKGTADKIAPINFAEEIRGITAGGGESGGERRYAYITNESFKSDFELAASLSMYVSTVKMNIDGMVIASPALPMLYNGMGTNIEPIALSIDFDMVAYTPFGKASLEEALAENQAVKEKWEALPKLTKEQFYTLE